MLNVERMRTLLAVREQGSIAAAARVLHVTPSGISQQLGKLEHETGQSLTARSGRGIRLTDAGVVLADHAARIVADIEAAETELADLHTEVLGPLRIGSIGSSVRMLAAPALRALLDKHPKVQPHLVDGEAVDMIPRLCRGELDLMIGDRWPNRPAPAPAILRTERMFAEPVNVALHHHHPLAGRSSLGLGELGTLSWVACIGDTRDALIAALSTVHTEPRFAYQIAEFPTQLELVRAGLAAALMPRISAGPAPAGVRFLPISPALHREVYVAWRRDTDRPVTRACIGELRAVATALTT